MNIVRLTALPVALALMVGCSEQDRRAVVVSAAVQACIGHIETRLQDFPVAQGVDTERLCTCFVDKVAAGRSLTELGELFTGNGPLPDPQALSQCAMEEGRRSGVVVDN